MRTQLSKLSVVVGVVMAAIMLTVLCPQPSKAQAQVIHQKFTIPLDDFFRVADPLFGACLTEDVHIFGTIPTFTYTVTDAKGGIHVKVSEIADLSAVGLSTGDTYHTQGPLTFTAYDAEGTAPFVAFFDNIVQLVGPGQDGKFMLHIRSHLVVNANGVQTVSVDKVDVVCH